MSVTVTQVTERDIPWVNQVFEQYWGGDFVVSRGRKHFPADLKGFYATDPHGSRCGLVTYRVEGTECEVVTLNAFTQLAGIGSALVDAIKDWAIRARCTRLWLITTNDNLDAIRFYQRREFKLVKVHAGAIEISRKLKPSIPLVGNFGIPLNDELEFELRL